MKATYDPKAKTKFLRSCRKEGKCYFNSYQIIERDAEPYAKHHAKTPISLRLYGTGNRNYACLWVGTESIHTQGSGWAGGYGYHRPSAAAHEAIVNAGFSLDKNIDGVGDDAIEEALLAIAECIGLKNYLIIRSYP